jgi:hypothetical protein
MVFQAERNSKAHGEMNFPWASSPPDGLGSESFFRKEECPTKILLIVPDTRRYAGGQRELRK